MNFADDQISEDNAKVILLLYSLVQFVNFIFLGAAARLHDEDIQKNCGNVIKKVLKEAYNDPIFNIKYGHSLTPGNKIAELAGDIIEIVSKDDIALKSSSKPLIEEIANIVSATNVLLPISRREMWKKFLKLANENLFRDCFALVIEKLHPSDVVVRGLSFFTMKRIVQEIYSMINIQKEKKTKTDIVRRLFLKKRSNKHFIRWLAIWCIFYKKV